VKIPESVDLENLPDYFAGENTIPTTPPESERKQGRGTVWVFIEMMCAFLTVTGVNMKVTDYNDTFQYQVERKWQVKEWVDQHDVGEDKKTPTQSI
jgi:hypothetical protein